MQPPIVYGRNITNGKLELIKSYSNILITDRTDKEYLTITMSGQSNGLYYDNVSTLRKFLIVFENNPQSLWWDGANLKPNPNDPTKKQACLKSSGLLFDNTLGKIYNLNINKKYLVNVTVNLNSLTIGRATTFQIALYNTDSGYNANLDNSFGNPFNPPCSAYGKQSSNNKGTTMSLAYVITNCTSFTILLKQLAATVTTVDTTPFDTNLSIRVIEI